MEAREYIIYRTDNDFTNFLHKVRVFWKDPFGELNERSGYFEDYEEAVEFEKRLSEVYNKLRFPYMTSFDGSVAGVNSHSENVPELFTARVSKELERKVC